MPSRPAGPCQLRQQRLDFRELFGLLAPEGVLEELERGTKQLRFRGGELESNRAGIARRSRAASREIRSPLAHRSSSRGSDALEGHGDRAAAAQAERRKAVAALASFQ